VDFDAKKIAKAPVKPSSPERTKMIAQNLCGKGVGIHRQEVDPLRIAVYFCDRKARFPGHNLVSYFYELDTI
jgi:hypothetical protein